MKYMRAKMVRMRVVVKEVRLENENQENLVKKKRLISSGNGL